MAPVALQRFRIVCLRAEHYEGAYDLGPLRIECDLASKALHRLECFPAGVWLACALTTLFVVELNGAP